MSETLDQFVRDALGELDGLSSGPVDNSGHCEICPDGHSSMLRVAMGGMGTIYRSTQQSLEREVAVKVMTAARKSPDMAERFRREALILGMLEHPNIVPIHDLGMDASGQLFYTMRLVRGRTLAEILHGLRHRPGEGSPDYRLPALVTVFRKICDALAFAHSRGVLHRDLKPENVMLGPFGEVLVMDWGLAKMIARPDGEAPVERISEQCREERDSNGGSGRADTHTLVGSVMGTPQFMSPEQASGRIADIDERSDIYSLGSILYNILLLRPPLEASTAREALEKAREGRITPLTRPVSTNGRTQRSGQTDAAVIRGNERLPHLPGGRVPPALAAVAMKALSPEPKHRYQSVTELISDVEAYEGGFATKAEDAGALKQVLLFTRRHRAMTVAAVIVLVSTAAFLLKLIASENRAVLSERSAVQEKDSTRRALARAQIALADAAVRESDGLAARAALNAVPADLRDSDWSYLLRQSDTSLATIRTRSSNAIQFAAPNPALPGAFAIVATNGSVASVNGRTGVSRLEFDSGFDLTKGSRLMIAVSPDGEELAVAQENTGAVTLFDAATGSRRRSWLGDRITHLTFSPTRRQLLATHIPTAGTRSMTLYDADSGSALWSIPCESDWAHAAFLPTGDSFVLAHGRSTVELRRCVDGGVVRRLPDSALYVHCLCVSPDGTMAAYGDEQAAVRCVRIDTGQPIIDFRADTSTTRQILFTPDSRHLLTLTYPDKRASNHLRLWDVENGFLLRSLSTTQTTPMFAALHPKSHELVITGEVTKSWDLAPNMPEWVAPCSVNGPWSDFAGPSDDLMCFGSEGQAQMLRLEPQGRVATVWQHDSGSQSPLASVSGDRHTVAYGGASPGTVFISSHEGSIFVPAQHMVLPEKPTFLRLNGNGSLLWTGAQVMDTSTGVCRREFRCATAGRLVDGHWLSDGRLAATFVDRGKWMLAILDANTGALLATAPAEARVLDLAGSPDGRWLAEVSSGKNLRLRDPDTLAVCHEFRVHDAGVTAVAFHPRRPIVATTSDDLTIRCWDYEKQSLVAEIRDLPIAPVTLAWSSTGDRLAAASVDRHARIWRDVLPPASPH